MGRSCHGLGEQLSFCQHQIRQAKERVELSRVLAQSSIADLAMPEQVLHPMKGVLHLRPHLRFEPPASPRAPPAPFRSKTAPGGWSFSSARTRLGRSFFGVPSFPHLYLPGPKNPSFNQRFLSSTLLQVFLAITGRTGQDLGQPKPTTYRRRVSFVRLPAK